MSGAQNAVMGDDNYGTQLPQAQIDKRSLDEERKAARFSKTDEFKKLKEHLEQRMKYYQSFLPDGRPITEDPSTENWIAANTIIAEFKSIIDTYERVAEAVDKANKDER